MKSLITFLTLNEVMRVGVSPDAIEFQHLENVRRFEAVVDPVVFASFYLPLLRRFAEKVTHISLRMPKEFYRDEDVRTFSTELSLKEFRKLELLDLWHADDCSRRSQGGFALRFLNSGQSAQTFPRLTRLKLNSYVTTYWINCMNLQAPELRNLDLTSLESWVFEFLEHHFSALNQIENLTFRLYNTPSGSEPPPIVLSLPKLREIHFEPFEPIYLLFFCWAFIGVKEVHARPWKPEERTQTRSFSMSLSEVQTRMLMSTNIQLVEEKTFENGQQSVVSETLDVWTLYTQLNTWRDICIFRLVLDHVKRAEVLCGLDRKIREMSFDDSERFRDLYPFYDEMGRVGHSHFAS